MKAKVTTTQTLPEFINEALYDRLYGYYSTGQVKFGPDFVTFGERWAPLLAERLFLMWKAMLAQGEISNTQVFYIYEFGAGTGKMALRVLEYIHGKSLIDTKSAWPAFFNAVKYIIGEISPALLNQQKATLRKYSRQHKVEIHQTDARVIDDIFPQGAGVVITNELIDAFPPHEITITETGKIYATVIDSSNDVLTTRQVPYKSILSDDEICFVDAVIEKSKDFSTIPRRFYIQPCITHFYQKLRGLLTKGYVVTLDYGDHAHDHFKKNRPLRTFSNKHGNDTSFLEHKGQLDITVDVNFSDLALAGEGQGFECAYYGLQDAIGGPFSPEFKIFFQRRNIKPDCDAFVFSGMALSSPVRYEDMPNLSKALAAGEALLLKMLDIISKLKTRIGQKQIARNEAESKETERLITHIDRALVSFLAWLDIQQYIDRDKAFMTELHEMFFAVIAELLSFLQNKDFVTATTISALFHNALTWDRHRAELFLIPICDQRSRVFNEKDPLEVAAVTWTIRNTNQWINVMIQKYPELVTRQFTKRLLTQYNFSITASVEVQKNSLLNRCLAAAQEDNFIAIKKIDARHFLLGEFEQEIKSFTSISSAPTAKKL